MNRITTKFLKQQYRLIAKQYDIQVKELPAKDFMLYYGEQDKQEMAKAVGVVAGAPELGYFAKKFCKKYAISRGDICVLINVALSIT